MKTFTRKEYNLVANALQNYNLYMSDSEKKIAEIIQDKLYCLEKNSFYFL